ncbi:hypothetical protein ACIPQJ_02560 [Streptomyces sp. NPDC090082]|uniref:hypothetical protein n=1 Tax=unclassified Streptomyces TaxID=2593676 RepID=UPI003819724E
MGGKHAHELRRDREFVHGRLGRVAGGGRRAAGGGRRAAVMFACPSVMFAGAWFDAATA